MNEIQIFKNTDYEVRTSLINEEPYFMLSDVCNILEINNVSQAKTRLKKDGVIRNEVIDSLGRKQRASFINESNLYKLVFQSRKPEAEKFTDWVSSEVIPSIRKHGGYLTSQKIEEALLNPDTLIQLATNLKEERTKRLVAEQQIKELKPRADYTDKILKNKGLVTITQIAKDYGMSGQALNDLLHELKVQYKLGKQWLLYEKYQAFGYTHSETIDIVRSDGRPDISMITKWTQKGRLFLYELLKENGYLPLIEIE